ncbi:MAG: hypothetical protein AAGF99_10885 [Bacteroidota bacterium]
MSCFDAFRKACPADLVFTERPSPATHYKYLLCGKGCVLGVLFEDSVALYFEWVIEDGNAVAYPPSVRYKSWPKCTVADYIRRGVWEAEPVRPLPYEHRPALPGGRDPDGTLAVSH